MRDPERIQILLDLIKELWLRDSDLRFNQLLYILQSEYSLKNNGIGLVKEPEIDGFAREGFDLFNTEDDSFINFIKMKISNDKNT
jgi:hypothetical protein